MKNARRGEQREQDIIQKIKKKRKENIPKTLIGEMVDEVQQQQQQDEHLKGTRWARQDMPNRPPTECPVAQPPFRASPRWARRTHVKFPFTCLFFAPASLSLSRSLSLSLPGQATKRHFGLIQCSTKYLPNLINAFAVLPRSPHLSLLPSRTFLS